MVKLAACGQQLALNGPKSHFPMLEFSPIAEIQTTVGVEIGNRGQLGPKPKN